MMRVKLSKLKQVCATAFLPRVFKESRSSSNKIEKCAIDFLSKAKKSSDSRYKDEKHEKQMRIIAKCFGEKQPDSDVKEYQDDTKELIKDKIIPIDVNEKNLSNQRQTLITKVFGADDEIHHATTAKLDEEKLTQKIDYIDETPHVEAGVDKVDGFNSTPKVLGQNTGLLNASEVDQDNSSDDKQVNLDELAKRCLGSQVGEIDKMLLNELKNISRESSLPLKVNFPTDESAQKYFSQIFERKTKGNTIVSDVSNTHLGQDPKRGKSILDQGSDQNRFQPLHLDTVPIFSIDENGMDYKESEIKRDYSSQGNTLLLDFPVVLEPYGMQAIPFYEYVSKEKITLQNVPQLEEVATIETVHGLESNAPNNEEVILQTDNTDKTSEITNEAKELEEAEADCPKLVYTKAVEPPMQVHNSTKETEVHKLSGSDVSKLLDYKDVISPKPESVKIINPNNEYRKLSDEADTQYDLTTSTQEPTDSQYENPSQKDSSTVSPDYPLGNAKRSLDLPNNTAISANQNPEEYYGIPKNTGKTFMKFDTKLTDAKITENILDHVITTDIKYMDSDVTTNESKVINAVVSDTLDTIASDIKDIDKNINNSCATDIAANKATHTNITDNKILDFIVHHTKATYTKVANTMLNHNKADFNNDNINSSLKATDKKNTDSVLTTDTYNVTDPKTIISKDTDAAAKNILCSDSKVNDVTAHGIKTTETLVKDTEANEVEITNTRVKDIVSTRSVNPMSQSIAYSTMPQLLEVEENSEALKELDLPHVHRKGPITHVLIQPESKLKEASVSGNSNRKDRSVCSEDTIPLSMLLKKVREQSRREINKAAYMKAVTKAEEANKNPCMTPLDKSKPKTTLNPNPCQPKPKDPCKSNPCKPAKKDPCAKFLPFFLNTVTKSSTSLNGTIPSIQKYNQMYLMRTPLSLTKAAYNEIVKKMNLILELLGIRHNVEDEIDVVYARDFDPWIPIPSWPVPKVQEKRPLACPKHGCKLPVRPIPSNTSKPCSRMPKKLSPTKTFMTPLVNMKFTSTVSGN